MKSILAWELPSPGTALVRLLQRSHLAQVETSAATSFSISADDIHFLSSTCRGAIYALRPCMLTFCVEAGSKTYPCHGFTNRAARAGAGRSHLHAVGRD